MHPPEDLRGGAPISALKRKMLGPISSLLASYTALTTGSCLKKSSTFCMSLLFIARPAMRKRLSSLPAQRSRQCA